MQRLEYLDRAKALAILLVVFGHLARQAPVGAEWYDAAKAVVYMFHMPLFMFLSGYVFWYSQSVDRAIGDFRGFAASRTWRLLVPFVVMAVIIIAGKLFVAHFTGIDRAPESVNSALYNVFFETEKSPVVFIWYIFCLFVYSLATPLLFKLLHGKMKLLLLLSAFVYFIPAPSDFYMNRLVAYYLFFVLGMFVSSNKLCEEVLERYSIVLGVCAVFAIYIFMTVYDAPKLIERGVVGLLIIWPILRFSKTSKVISSKLLIAVGRYSFAIYLFNTIAIGISKLIVLRLSLWSGSLFPLAATILLFSGVALPILAKRFLISRVPIVDRITN